MCSSDLNRSGCAMGFVKIPFGILSKRGVATAIPAPDFPCTLVDFSLGFLVLFIIPHLSRTPYCSYSSFISCLISLAALSLFHPFPSVNGCPYAGNASPHCCQMRVCRYQRVPNLMDEEGSWICTRQHRTPPVPSHSRFRLWYQVCAPPTLMTEHLGGRFTLQIRISSMRVYRCATREIATTNPTTVVSRHSPTSFDPIIFFTSLLVLSISWVPFLE